MARQKTVIDKVYCSPGDVIPCGLNWGPWLSVTEDTIYDFDGLAGTFDSEGNPIVVLPVEDSWFANTYTNLLIGPVPRGRWTAKFDIATEGDEHYHRELLIISR